MGKKKSPFWDKLLIDDTIITDDSVKCRIFRDYFCTVYDEKLPSIPVSNIVERISDSVNNTPTNIYSFDNSFISLENEILS